VGPRSFCEGAFAAGRGGGADVVVVVVVVVVVGVVAGGLTFEGSPALGGPSGADAGTRNTS